MEYKQLYNKLPALFINGFSCLHKIQLLIQNLDVGDNNRPVLGVSSLSDALDAITSSSLVPLSFLMPFLI